MDQIRFANEWHRNYARYLSYTGRLYEYRSHIVQLTQGVCPRHQKYPLPALHGNAIIPDFFLPEEKTFILVSQVCRIEKMLIWCSLIQQLTGMPCGCVDRRKYYKIERQHGSVIPDWRYDRRIVNCSYCQKPFPDKTGHMKSHSRECAKRTRLLEQGIKKLGPRLAE